LELELAVADRCRRGIAVGEGHRRTLHPQPLIGERSELTEGAALVALEDPLARLGLLVGSALVDDDAELPAARGQILREDIDQPDVYARQIGVVEVAVGDLKDEVSVALTVGAGRRAIDRTRTDELTRAVCEIAPGDLPSHIRTS